MANPLVNGVPASWQQAWKDIVDFGFNLNELFTGGDPFKPAPVAAVAEATPAPTTPAAPVETPAEALPQDNAQPAN
jgi:hypothetical protein